MARIGLLVSLVLLGMWSSACATTPLGPPPRATEAYERGDYNTALVHATTEYHRTTGDRRDLAALIAGLSAHALDQNEQAAEWLEPLVDHRDREISGRASATLGLVRAEQGRHEAAAGLLAAASRKLDGEAAAQANFQAAESYAAIGRIDTARLHYRLAAVGSDETIAALAEQRLELAGYAVQLGAFRSRTNAEQHARQAAPRLRSLGLGDPRVVERATDGSPWFLVQAGNYSTRSAAAAARARYGPSAVVAPAASGS